MNFEEYKPQHIVEACCIVFDLKPAEFYSRRRTSRIARGRLASYYLCREFTALSYSGIGRFMRKDHTTVIKGAERAELFMDTDPDFSKKINVATQWLRNKKSQVEHNGIFRFVPHSDVSTYEQKGWHIASDLADSHHGRHAVIMRKDDQLSPQYRPVTAPD